MKLLLLLLLLTGCATNEYVESHKFLKKNSDFFNEVCYTIHSPDDVSGNYCLKKIK